VPIDTKGYVGRGAGKMPGSEWWSAPSRVVCVTVSPCEGALPSHKVGPVPGPVHASARGPVHELTDPRLRRGESTATVRRPPEGWATACGRRRRRTGRALARLSSRACARRGRACCRRPAVVSPDLCACVQTTAHASPPGRVELRAAPAAAPRSIRVHTDLVPRPPGPCRAVPRPLMAGCLPSGQLVTGWPALKTPGAGPDDRPVQARVRPGSDRSTNVLWSE
jgi:hypothetical protein